LYVFLTNDLCIQVADLTEQLASKTDADDAIMVAVDNKIEEWKVGQSQ